MQRGTQPACIFGRLPLLRLAYFCRRQRLSYAANNSSLFHPPDAVAVFAPAAVRHPPFGGTGRELLLLGLRCGVPQGRTAGVVAETLLLSR